MGPRLWLAILLVALTGFFCGEWHESRASNAQRQAADSAAKLELATATGRVREVERQLSQNILNIDEARTKEQDHANATIDSLRTDVRNGALRLSIATRAHDPGPVGADPAAGDPEARAELLPSAAIALIDLAADADSTVRALNACLDQYDAVRRAVNP